jgi:hypothetical protein
MKSGSTWLGWNVAAAPQISLHVRLHLTPRHLGVARVQKHERVRLGEQSEPMTVTALDKSSVSDDLREAALY